MLRSRVIRVCGFRVDGLEVRFFQGLGLLLRVLRLRSAWYKRGGGESGLSSGVIRFTALEFGVRV